MSKTVEEVRRAAFEKWLSKRPHVLNIGFRGGKYLLADDQEQWEAFNAALDAVEIELPTPGAAMASVFDYQHSTRNKSVTGTTNWAANVGMVVVEDCRAAIEQTGLGLRVL